MMQMKLAMPIWKLFKQQHEHIKKTEDFESRCGDYTNTAD
jgi:hypothetical protein